MGERDESQSLRASSQNYVSFLVVNSNNFASFFGGWGGGGAG